MDRTQAHIRPYRPADIDALYHICLLTGDRGQDATSLHHDPKLLGALLIIELTASTSTSASPGSRPPTRTCSAWISATP